MENSIKSLIGFLESRGFVFSVSRNTYFQHYSSSRRFIVRHNQIKGLMIHKVANICFDSLFTVEKSYRLTEASKYGTLDWALSS